MDEGTLFYSVPFLFLKLTKYNRRLKINSMSTMILRAKLAYNRWYLSQLTHSSWNVGNFSEKTSEAIKEQKKLVKALERLYANRKAQ